MLLFAKLHIRHEYYMYMLIIVKLIYINVLQVYYVFDSLYLTLTCFSQDNIARTKISPKEKNFCSQISVCIILNKSFSNTSKFA